jgi:hypothetical protein
VPNSARPAIEGGLILAYAKLLRIALWPARKEARFTAQLLHLVGRRGARRIARQPALAGIEELF